MKKKSIPNIEDVYGKLTKWLNDGKGKKILEVGVYNDYIKCISLVDNIILIILSEKTLYVKQDEVIKLKIHKKYNILTFSD